MVPGVGDSEHGAPAWEVLYSVTYPNPNPNPNRNRNPNPNLGAHEVYATCEAAEDELAEVLAS